MLEEPTIKDTSNRSNKTQVQKGNMNSRKERNNVDASAGQGLSLWLGFGNQACGESNVRQSVLTLPQCPIFLVSLFVCTKSPPTPRLLSIVLSLRAVV